MSASPLRIALYLNHLFTWQGGKEYARNLLLGLQAFEKLHPGSMEVHLIAWQSTPVGELEEFRPLAGSLHIIPGGPQDGTQPIFEVLRLRRIDFAFPIHSTEPGGIRTADWIYDFQHKTLPHFFTTDDIEERDLSFARMLEHAGRIIVSSETARNDLQKYFPGNDAEVRTLRFATFPNKEWVAQDPRLVLQRYQLPERFFLVSGQFWIHKNHTLVFQAVKKLLDQGIAVDLVCTGPLTDYRRPAYFGELLAYLHQSGIYGRVRLMGLMPRLDQLQVMRCALAVIQPSLFEGWSTVLEDARTLGKKTFCSSLPVHLEQNLPGADFFAPDDLEELAQLMAQLWKSEKTGIDPDREAQAFEQAMERSLAFAQTFYSIASEPFIAAARSVNVASIRQVKIAAISGPTEFVKKFRELENKYHKSEASLAQLSDQSLFFYNRLWVGGKMRKLKFHLEDQMVKHCWMNLEIGHQHQPCALRREKFPRPSLGDDALPSIGIVTPSFMQGRFLDRTMQSVLSQEYPGLSYIVQDGGSRDESVDIIKRHASKLAAWESAPDGGQSDAVKRGFQKCKTDIMAWLNSDDMLMPGALRFVGEYFASHPRVDAIYGHRVMIDENDGEVGRWVLPRHKPEILKWLDYVPQETLFWRRDLWEKVGGVDTSFKFALDWDLLVKFEKAGAKIVRVPYFLGCFRLHEAQKTSAQIGTHGTEEMARIREGIHGRPIEDYEVAPYRKLFRIKAAKAAYLLSMGIRI